MESFENTSWQRVDEMLESLQELLTTIPDDSPHALQAHNIINKVRESRIEWANDGGTRNPGRKSGVFPINGDEELIKKGLQQLINDCYNPNSRIFKPLDQQWQMTCPQFFALLYDACIQAELASGNGDLNAFYKILVETANNVGKRFKMAEKTLNNQVKGWENYVSSDYCQGTRVLLHKLSQNDCVSKILRRQLSAEKSHQQKVIELARKYRILPPEDLVGR